MSLPSYDDDFIVLKDQGTYSTWLDDFCVLRPEGADLFLTQHYHNPREQPPYTGPWWHPVLRSTQRKLSMVVYVLFRTPLGSYPNFFFSKDTHPVTLEVIHTPLRTLIHVETFAVLA